VDALLCSGESKRSSVGTTAGDSKAESSAPDCASQQDASESGSCCSRTAKSSCKKGECGGRFGGGRLLLAMAGVALGALAFALERRRKR
jgi:hypothetical protein